MDRFFEAIQKVTREWPVILAALALLSLPLAPPYVPTRANLLDRDRRRISTADRLDDAGRPEDARRALALFLASRPDSSYVAHALLRRAEMTARRALLGEYPNDNAMAAADRDAQDAYERAGSRLPNQLRIVVGRATREGITLGDLPSDPVAAAEAAIARIRSPSTALRREADLLNSLADARRAAPSVRRRIGAAYLRHHRYPNAEQTFWQTYTEMGQDRPEVLLDRAYAIACGARAALPQYSWDQAVQQVDDHQRRAPPERAVDGVEMLCRLWFMRDQPAEVLRIVEARLAAETDPVAVARLLVQRGIARKRLDDLVGAQQDLEAAEPGLPEELDQRRLAQYHLADVLRRSQDTACLSRFQLLEGRSPELAALSEIGRGRLYLDNPGLDVNPVPLLHAGLSQIDGVESLDRFAFDARRFYEDIQTRAATEETPAGLLPYGEVLAQWRRLYPEDRALYQAIAALHTRAARMYARERRAHEDQRELEAAQQTQEEAAAQYAAAAQQYVDLITWFGDRLQPPEVMTYRRLAGHRYFEGRLYRAAYDQYARGVEMRPSSGWQTLLFMAALSMSRSGVCRAERIGQPDATTLFQQYLQEVVPTEALISNALLEIGRIQIGLGEYAEAIETLHRIRDTKYSVSPVAWDALENVLRESPGFEEREPPGVLIEYEQDRPPRRRHVWGLMDLEVARAGLLEAGLLRGDESAAERHAFAINQGTEAALDYVRREVPAAEPEGPPPAEPIVGAAEFLRRFLQPPEAQRAPPESVVVLLTLARLRIEREEWTEAIEPLRRAREIGEMYAGLEERQPLLSEEERTALRQSLILLGEVLERLGHAEGAYEAFDRACRRFAGSPEVMWALAGRARTALALAPTDVGADDSRRLERQRRLADAVASLAAMEQILDEAGAAYDPQFGGRGVAVWRERIAEIRRRLPTDAPAAE